MKLFHAAVRRGGGFSFAGFVSRGGMEGRRTAALLLPVLFHAAVWRGGGGAAYGGVSFAGLVSRGGTEGRRTAASLWRVLLHAAVRGAAEG